MHTNRMNLFSGQIISVLVSLCICLMREANAGGKGKVPIYMPIPIPIPMPVGPMQGGSGKHPHPPHHQRHRDEPEGEVKKIYLLQPVQKLQPQPSLKGGGLMGPIQNHVHIQTPMSVKNSVQHPVVKHPQRHSMEGDFGNINQLHESDSHGGRWGGNNHNPKSNPDLRILPIVVIPPVAPMPTIHLHQSSPLPRMTLNNYGLAESERKKTHSSSPARRTDYQTFADYGGSGGGSMFKKNYDPKTRPTRSRVHPRVRDRPIAHHLDTVTWARTRARNEDLNDDFDFGPSSYNKNINEVIPRNGYRRSGGLRRRVQHFRDEQVRPLSSRTARDIIENQVFFDDDPESAGDMRESIVSNRNDGNQGQDYTNERRNSEIFGYRGSQEDHLQSSSNPINSRIQLDPRHFDFIDGKELNASGDYSSFDDHSPQFKQHPFPGNTFDDSPVTSTINDDLQQSKQQQHPVRAQQTSDLNSLYYDHDVEQAARSSRASRLSQTSRYQPSERELLEDDEWWFDSVKSMSHSDPSSSRSFQLPPNSTSISGNVSSSVIIARTKPPNDIVKNDAS